MTESTHQLIASALRLDPGERTVIVNAILASLDDASDLHQDAQIRDAWKDEVRTRIADMDSGRVKTIPSAEAWKMIDGESQISD